MVKRVPLSAATPFEQGRKSAKAGYGDSGNPYPRGTFASREWQQGFYSNPQQPFAY